LVMELHKDLKKFQQKKRAGFGKLF